MVPVTQVAAWDFAADVRNAPLWVFGVRSVAGDLHQPPRTGDRLRARLIAGGRVADSVWEIAECRRPDFLSSHGRALGATATLRIDCVPHGDDLTEVRYRLQYQLPGGPLGALAARLGVHGVLDAQVRYSLRTLRRLLTAQRRGRALPREEFGPG